MGSVYLNYVYRGQARDAEGRAYDSYSVVRTAYRESGVVYDTGLFDEEGKLIEKGSDVEVFLTHEIEQDLKLLFNKKYFLGNAKVFQARTRGQIQSALNEEDPVIVPRSKSYLISLLQYEYHQAGSLRASNSLVQRDFYEYLRDNPEIKERYFKGVKNKGVYRIDIQSRGGVAVEINAGGAQIVTFGVGEVFYVGKIGIRIADGEIDTGPSGFFVAQNPNRREDDTRVKNVFLFDLTDEASTHGDKFLGDYRRYYSVSSSDWVKTRLVAYYEYKAYKYSSKDDKENNRLTAVVESDFSGVIKEFDYWFPSKPYDYGKITLSGGQSDGLVIEIPPGLYPVLEGFKGFKKGLDGKIPFDPIDLAKANIATKERNQGVFNIYNRGTKANELDKFLNKVANVPNASIMRRGNKIIIRSR